MRVYLRLSPPQGHGPGCGLKTHTHSRLFFVKRPPRHTHCLSGEKRKTVYKMKYFTFSNQFFFFLLNYNTVMMRYKSGLHTCCRPSAPPPRSSHGPESTSIDSFMESHLSCFPIPVGAVGPRSLHSANLYGCCCY